MTNRTEIIGAATCGTCRWALPAQDREGKIDWNRRFCRGAPPFGIAIGVNPQTGPIINYFWPIVSNKDWCGRHEPRGDLETPLPGEKKPGADDVKPDA